MACDPDPKVPIDFNPTAQSCVFSPDQTRVVGGRMVRVLVWHDNEWGFSARMADVAGVVGRLENQPEGPWPTECILSSPG